MTNLDKYDDIQDLFEDAMFDNGGFFFGYGQLDDIDEYGLSIINESNKGINESNKGKYILADAGGERVLVNEDTIFDN